MYIPLRMGRSNIFMLQYITIAAHSTLIYLLVLVEVLIRVAFFTLLERKVLGYIHIRKGPNKVSWGGLLQPIADAVKLFSKERFSSSKFHNSFFVGSPLLGLILSLVLWLVIPIHLSLLSFSFLILFAIISVRIYYLLGRGWRSNSKFSRLGSFRAVAQSISYEVVLIILALGIVYLICSVNLINLTEIQPSIWFGILFPPMLITWVRTILAETNRRPYDFREGERELVSGFNTEYSGGLFSLLFISEYANIIFLSILTCLLFLGGSSIIMLKTLLLCLVFLWVRGSLPRLRYDILIKIAWTSYLPLALCLVFLRCPIINP